MKSINKFVILNALLLGIGLSYGSYAFNNTPKVIDNNLTVQSIKNVDELKNGLYEVPVTNDLSMGGDSYSNMGLIEKDNDNYYVTISQAQPDKLINQKLLYPGKVGEIVQENGTYLDFTYTVDKEDLSRIFPIEVTVKKMNKVINFNVKFDLEKATYKQETIRDLGERPAKFVPVIDYIPEDIELEKGSIYNLPDVKATLRNDEIRCRTQVFYLNNDKETPVEVVENRINLNKIGVYKVVISAESDLYKTSLGNNTSSTIEYKITSKIGATSLGKFEDPNKILPEGIQLQVSKVTSGEFFEKAVNNISKISENYEIFNFNLFEVSGESYQLKDEINLYLRVDDYFNRNKIKVNYLDESGNLLDSYKVENFGRYIKFNANKTGNFIVYVEGIEFKMPIYGYAIIGVTSLVVVAGAIITTVIIKKKKSKKNN